ncbi:hypothetical protein VNO78_30895 [Psophocarpus tetragonolobus]|uniref:GDSL esterase/lipase n=1 Tax=Psophocarpus tetragonolobus TaxID=3891 RepID=A0AAN9X6I6_PSOTE
MVRPIPETGGPIGTRPAGRFSNGRLIIDFIGGVFACLMPKREYFDEALYTFVIGQNDLGAGFSGNMTVQQVNAPVPDMVNVFSKNIKDIYDLGARSFWIYNTGPIGYLPYILANFLSAERDAYGCAKPYNDVAQYFNHKLKVLDVAMEGRTTRAVVFGFGENILANGIS